MRSAFSDELRLDSETVPFFRFWANSLRMFSYMETS